MVITCSNSQSGDPTGWSPMFRETLAPAPTTPAPSNRISAGTDDGATGEAESHRTGRPRPSKDAEDILEVTHVWAPFGGAPEEEVFVRFGIPPTLFTERLWHHRGVRLRRGGRQTIQEGPPLSAITLDDHRPQVSAAAPPP
ncbi:hypothetical protein RHA1_ro08451 (plasmid) [Rhodococcus jostii RHA1]|uniref:Uncharacterized protein n=1 Tax=Rhodococcus jostii (strain RHA1) TaxID=101510 RepID=Q0RYZ1_RHOJR|nr:hypothetical protein RHA1_ro08451 [Rhodococcus jostii RHA1]